MWDDNKGFSLVELIIVVAIMAAITGVVGYGLNLSSGKAADECAQKLASSLQHARTSTMGKFKTTITISKDDDGVWAQETVTVANKDTGREGEEKVGERVKIGDKNVKIVFDDGTDITDWTGGGSVSFEFDRSSGALKSVDMSAAISFTISKASKTRIVEIVPLTGKVTVK